MFGYLYSNDDQLIRLLDGGFYHYDPDIVIWPIPPAPPQLFTRPASVINISKKPRYFIPKSAMMDALGVERQPPPPQIFDFTWDDVSEQSRLQADQYKDQIYDEGISRFFIPAAYDTDAEQQMLQPAWNLDYEEEREGVPFIIVNPGIIRDWDSDIENQIQQLGWINDYTDYDVEIPIAPVVVIIPILYKLSTHPVIKIELQPVPAVQLYQFSSARSMHIGSQTSWLELKLYKLTVQNSMMIQSFTIHGPV